MVSSHDLLTLCFLAVLPGSQWEEFGEPALELTSLSASQSTWFAENCKKVHFDFMEGGNEYLEPACVILMWRNSSDLGTWMCEEQRMASRLLVPLKFTLGCKLPGPIRALS